MGEAKAARQEAGSKWMQQTHREVEGLGILLCHKQLVDLVVEGHLAQGPRDALGDHEQVCVLP